MKGFDIMRGKRTVPGKLREAQNLLCYSFFILKGKNGFLMGNGAGANPFDHQLVTPAPIEESPYGPMGGEDRVPLSPAASKSGERDPISKEEVDTAGIGVRGRAGWDKRFVTRGSSEEREVVEEAGVGNG